MAKKHCRRLRIPFKLRNRGQFCQQKFSKIVESAEERANKSRRVLKVMGTFCDFK